ncbi:MAG: ribbon-helix-helix domain-containing protein [Nostoc sp.]
MFSCSEGTKEDLESWAEDEGRSISNLIERIVMDAIAKRKKKTRNKNDEGE